MKTIIILLYLTINSSLLFAQTVLTVERTSTVNTVTAEWLGYAIARNVSTTFTYRNNSITSVNSSGYLLQAGDEVAASTNNNLDGAAITGNKFTWNGIPGSSITHGVFTGYNKNDVIKYNYLDKVPYALVIKSGENGTNMAYTSGGFAYNIIKNPDIGVRIKGMNGVLVYNNTFYDNLNSGDYFIFITNNPDLGNGVASTGTKIKNNIFYSTTQLYNIYVEAGCESGFECDYNVYYCEAGTPMFNYQGAAKTFAQWQALGYDTHSKVINPNFINFTDFVPNVRLDYGVNLGTTWQTGLSVNAVWGTTDPATTNQNGTWQVGARIYGSTSINPDYISSVVENATPNLLSMTYSLTLANIVPLASSFSVKVNTVARNVNTVTVSGAKVLLTLASPVIYGDAIMVSYTKPSSNPIQTASGGQAATISNQTVKNNVNPSVPAYVSSAIENATPAILEITYTLSLANIVPASSAFSVKVNSVARTINTVSISGTKVILALAIPALYSDVVTIAYTKPANNPLQTPSGGQAATISSQSVTNKINNPSILQYINSAVGNSSPALLEINYNLTLANVLPAPSSFIVRVNSIARNVNSMAISGTSVVLTLASEVFYGDVVTVAYTKPASNPLQSTSGLKAATMSAQSVDNKLNSDGPAYVSSSIENATPRIIELTYNLSLANVVPATSAFNIQVNSVAIIVNSVSISGNKVRLTLSREIRFGDIVTVTYTKPADNPLQTVTGGQAMSIYSQLIINKIIAPTSSNNIRMTIYPNPIQQILNISLDYTSTLSNLEPYVSPKIIRIYDISGTLFIEKLLESGITKVQILINLKPGIYIVFLLSGGLRISSQKIIVN